MKKNILLLLLLISITCYAQQNNNDKPFEVVEVMPSFPGGDTELFAFISRNVKYPVLAQEANIQGRVVVGFTVSKDGSIINPKIVRGVALDLDAEALRVVQSMPRWEPGTQQGKPVSVYNRIPITFKLLGDGASKEEIAAHNAKVSRQLQTRHSSDLELLGSSLKTIGEGLGALISLLPEGSGSGGDTQTGNITLKDWSVKKREKYNDYCDWMTVIIEISINGQNERFDPTVYYDYDEKVYYMRGIGANISKYDNVKTLENFVHKYVNTIRR